MRALTGGGAIARWLEVELPEIRNTMVDLLGESTAGDLGREFKKGLHEGEMMVLRRQMAKRFGPIPAWVDEQLASRSVRELEILSERLLDATTLEDFLK